MSFIRHTGHPGKKHIKAQNEIARILKKYYRSVVLEFEVPLPTPYLKYNPKSHDFVPYIFDVYAAEPILQYSSISTVKYFHVGIEIYGDVGHKHTRRQYKRDEYRNKALEAYFGVFVQPYDTDDIVGRGQRVKGTLKFKPLITEEDILKDLSIFNTDITTLSTS